MFEILTDAFEVETMVYKLGVMRGAEVNPSTLAEDELCLELLSTKYRLTICMSSAAL